LGYWLTAVNEVGAVKAQKIKAAILKCADVARAECPDTEIRTRAFHFLDGARESALEAMAREPQNRLERTPAEQAQFLRDKVSNG
jgi:hypothetical protein